MQHPSKYKGFSTSFLNEGEMLKFIINSLNRLYRLYRHQESGIRRFKSGIRRFTSFLKVASGGSVLGVNFGLGKNDHKKLAIRKKSTILGFLPSNFNTQLVMPVNSQEKNLAKIGGHLPPKIMVQRESQLYGTNGTCRDCTYTYRISRLQVSSVARLIRLGW